MKLIREGRFGPPKCFKSGAVIGTYPKPMLVLMLDSEGLSMLPPRGYIFKKGEIPIDTFFEDVVWSTTTELSDWVKKPAEELPKVLAVDLADVRIEQPNELYQPVANKRGYQDFITILRTLVDKCPFATVVLDPVTGLSEVVHQHIAGVNSKRLDDAMKLSPDIGYQILKTQGTLSLLKAHTVMIMHETLIMELDNVTRKSSLKEVRPMIPSKFARERIGGLLTQYLYQHHNMGEPEVLTKDSGYIKAGLGCRWPHGLPAVVGPTFKDIYERNGK